MHLKRDLDDLLRNSSCVGRLVTCATGYTSWRKSRFAHGIVGGIFIAVSTSIPELVVAIAAVRMGALNLAVGDIVGGNAFDTLFIAASDITYREEPIYAYISSAEQFWLANSMLMTSVLLMGLIYRERHGPGNIGLESVVLLVLYFGGLITLSLIG